MKKNIVLTAFLSLTSFGISFAHCGGYTSVKDHCKTEHKIVFTYKTFQLFKYYDHKDNTRFTIKNLDGEILAKNMSRLKLRLDFPEIAKKRNQENIAKL